jgi:hypothetical protein
MNQLVVARFNEEIPWIHNVQGWEKLVVNKGEFAEIPILFAQEKIENVGREAGTFLRFIVENYDNLPDQMAFLQGNPFDHAPHAILELNNFAENSPAFEWFNREAKVSCDWNGNPQHTGLDLVSPCVELQIPLPKEFEFVPGGQFTVSRDRVHRYAVSAYVMLRHLADHGVNGPWIVERFWGLLFA